MIPLIAVNRRLLVYGQLQIGEGRIQFRLGDDQQAAAIEHQRHRGRVVAVRSDLRVAAKQAARLMGQRVRLDRRSPGRLRRAGGGQQQPAGHDERHPPVTPTRLIAQCMVNLHRVDLLSLIHI